MPYLQKGVRQSAVSGVIPLTPEPEQAGLVALGVVRRAKMMRWAATFARNLADVEGDHYTCWHASALEYQSSVRCRQDPLPNIPGVPIHQCMQRIRRDRRSDALDISDVTNTANGELHPTR